MGKDASTLVEVAAVVDSGTEKRPFDHEGPHQIHEVELERNFSFLSCLGLAFAMLNSWTAMAASLSVVLPSGGSVSMVWGLLVSAVGTLVMTLSLAEICHCLPLSGGQYDWTYIMAPARMKNGLSFFCGWNATAGWIALIATASSLGSNFVVGVIALYDPTWDVQTWQTFLLYIAFTLLSFLLNVFGIKILPLVDRIAGSWALVGIVTVSVVLLACSRGNYQPPANVFTRFTNETGWPDGMAFLLGLLQSTFGLTAFDGATHMIEEMPSPAKNAPRVMIWAIFLGSVTSWVFLIVLLFCLRDFDTVVGAMNPLLEIYRQAVGSRAGATCLLIFNIMSMVFAGQGLLTVASRMLMTFARDRGIGQMSPALARVHPKLKVPFWSVVFCTVWVVVFGLINLGSSVALNAILSASVVFLEISYFVPILLILLRGERALEGHTDGRTWSLGRARFPINLAALMFVSLTCVCFLFPPAIPVTGPTMNYVIVVVGISMLMSAVTWVVDGRKRFNGPDQLEERLAVGKSA